MFGFHQLEDAHKKEMKSLNMLVFPGTDMLQKQLLKREISDGNMIVLPCSTSVFFIFILNKKKFEPLDLNFLSFF